MKNCINCGKEIPIDSSFCLHCGFKQSMDEPIEAAHCVTEEVCDTSVSEPEIVVPATAIPKVKKGSRVSVIVRNAIIVAVSILLLVGAFFPITNTDLEDVLSLSGVTDLDAPDVKFGLNTFQYITLFFDSFKKVEDPDELSDLRNEAAELQDELEDVSGTAKANRVIDKLFFILVRVGMQSITNAPLMSVAFCAVLGILNIILAIALFVLACLNLLATFHIIKRGGAPLYKWTIALMTAAPALILANHCAGCLALGGGLSVLAMCSVIFAAAAVIMVTIIRYIFAKKDNTRNVVTRSFALALSVIVFCLAFAPAFSATFHNTETGKNYERTLKVYHCADFFETFSLVDTEDEEFEALKQKTKEDKIAYFAEEMDVFSAMTKKEVRSKQGTLINTMILCKLLGAKVSPITIRFFSFTSIFFILTAVFALIIFWQSLYFFATGKHIKSLIFISKICAAAVATAALVVTIVFVTKTASHAEVYIGSDYRLRVSAGVILMTIFAIGAIFCPASLTAREKKIKSPKARRAYENIEQHF